MSSSMSLLRRQRVAVVALSCVVSITVMTGCQSAPVGGDPSAARSADAATSEHAPVATPSSSPTPAAVAGSTAYTPVYAEKQGAAATETKRGAIQGDFRWAVESPTLQDAESRWQEFLQAHNPPGGEFEDGFHANYVNSAKYELMRVYYLRGRVEKGDALMRDLDPLDLLK